LIFNAQLNRAKLYPAIIGASLGEAMKSSLELSGTQPYRMEKHRRQLPFAKAKNFRDLGGYPTSDGRTVRWGVVYRSDSLHKLNENDLKLLASLNLSHVFDFRSENEAEREPDRLPDAV